MRDKQEIVNAVNGVLGQYTGRLSLRQIYYRLVSKHVIPNNLNEYKTLSRILVEVRESGEVDWTRIEDRNRDAEGGDWGYNEPPDINAYISYRIKEAVKDANIRMRKWLNQPERIEIWIEKDALSVLALGVAEPYSVVVCPSKGYSSFTYLKEAVIRINQYDAPCTILYFGDYDPSGLDITRDLEERLRKYGANNLITVERHALNREQIDKHQLPPFPAKTSDARYSKFVADTGSNDAVELDALEPPILEKYIDDAINQHWDESIYDDIIELENEINKKINEALEPLREIIKRLQGGN